MTEGFLIPNQIASSGEEATSLVRRETLESLIKGLARNYLAGTFFAKKSFNTGKQEYEQPALKDIFTIDHPSSPEQDVLGRFPIISLYPPRTEEISLDHLYDCDVISPNEVSVLVKRKINELREQHQKIVDSFTYQVGYLERRLYKLESSNNSSQTSPKCTMMPEDWAEEQRLNNESLADF